MQPSSSRERMGAQADGPAGCIYFCVAATQAAERCTRCGRRVSAGWRVWERVPFPEEHREAEQEIRRGLWQGGVEARPDAI